MAIALSVFCFTFATRAQEHPALQDHPTKEQQARPISDEQLKAFVKAYVQERKIRETYASALKNAKNSYEADKIQQETNSKIEEALQRQGLDTKAYNRIFWTIRTNKELRKKALTLIEKEQNRP